MRVVLHDQSSTKLLDRDAPDRTALDEAPALMLALNRMAALRHQPASYCWCALRCQDG
jgi:hypothetical protein